jgi:hypothetical protein
MSVPAWVLFIASSLVNGLLLLHDRYFSRPTGFPTSPNVS